MNRYTRTTMIPYTAAVWNSHVTDIPSLLLFVLMHGFVQPHMNMNASLFFLLIHGSLSMHVQIYRYTCLYM